MRINQALRILIQHKKQDDTISPSSYRPVDNETYYTPPTTPILEFDYAITIRLTNTGKDIKIGLATEPPYLSVANIKKQLVPYLDPSVQIVKLIHLGNILTDETKLGPSNQPIIGDKGTVIRVKKGGVIQAMTTKLC
jgi:hypothetical protein